jgi:hypothetical protein
MLTMRNLGGVALFPFRYDVPVVDANVRWPRHFY